MHTGKGRRLIPFIGRVLVIWCVQVAAHSPQQKASIITVSGAESRSPEVDITGGRATEENLHILRLGGRRWREDTPIQPDSRSDSTTA
jgi:hypothetical protein